MSAISPLRTRRRKPREHARLQKVKIKSRYFLFYLVKTAFILIV